MVSHLSGNEGDIPSRRERTSATVAVNGGGESDEWRFGERVGLVIREFLYLGRWGLELLPRKTPIDAGLNIHVEAQHFADCVGAGHVGLVNQPDGGDPGANLFGV